MGKSQGWQNVFPKNKGQVFRPALIFKDTNCSFDF